MLAVEMLSVRRTHIVVFVFVFVFVFVAVAPVKVQSNEIGRKHISQIPVDSVFSFLNQLHKKAEHYGNLLFRQAIPSTASPEHPLLLSLRVQLIAARNHRVPTP